MVFFFYEQKTADESRISDWSSDVCSSYLPRSRARIWRRIASSSRPISMSLERFGRAGFRLRSCSCHRTRPNIRRRKSRSSSHGLERPTCRTRSEEHTSELQSLMRISYAVFCLKKTIHNNDSRKCTTNKSKNIHQD